VRRRTVSGMHTDDLRSRERHDPHCLAPGALADLLAPTGWRRLAVMGDSIAAGVGDPVPGYADVSWADRMAAALGGDDAAYLNLGVRELLVGEIRRGQLARALAFRPDVAVVTGGGNDMLRRSFDPAAVDIELDRMVGALRATGAEVVTFGLLDLSRTSFVPDSMRADLRDRLQRLNAATRAVSERHDAVHVDFFDHPALDETLFSADMIHPNRRGHACIATSVVRALAERSRAPAPGAGVRAPA
jgi:lysophospholipase L1-like esterase